MTSTTILDIEKICRVCLQNNLEMKLIFESQEEPTIAEMLSELTAYKVERFDDLPDLICLDCIKLVLSAYKLKQKCEQSYRILLTMINNDQRSDDTICNFSAGLLEKSTQTEESSMYPCERCQANFFSFDALRFHRLEEHKGSDIVCRFCSRTFDRIGYLKSHLAVFHPNSGYQTNNQCHICDRLFTRRELVKRHLRVVHKIMYDDLEAPKRKQEKQNNEKNINEQKKAENIKAAEREFDDLLHVDNIEILTEDEDEIPLADLINNKATSSQIMEAVVLEKTLADLLDSTSLPPHTIEDDLNECLIEDAIKIEENPKKSQDMLKQTNNILGIILQPPKLSRGRPRKKPPICKYCDKSFNNPSILKTHISKDHIEAQHFPCQICNHNLTNQKHWESHLKNNHREEKKLIKCDQCDKSFNCDSHYKRHKKIHGNKVYQCSKCEKCFSSNNFLQKHINNHDKKRYTCKECSQGFLTREELNNHAKLEAHDKPLLCPQCGLRCKTGNLLTIHIRRHKGEKPFKCKFCSKGFPRMDDLRIHEKYHTGEKTHFCETCGKGFLRKYNLRIHLRVHTGEKPYKCPHCPQAFSQGNDLKAHIRRHTGERFPCEICGAAFLQGYQIRQHRFQEHGIHEIAPTQRVKKFTSQEQQEKQIQLNLQKELRKKIYPGDSEK